MNRLKTLREETGKSITQVSEELKIPYQTYRNYEIGKREPRDNDTWRKMSNYYGVSTAYLMGLTDSKTDDSQESSKRVEKYIMNSTDIEAISSTMKELVANGDLELASTITRIFGNFALLIDFLYRSNQLDEIDNLEKIIESLNEIMSGNFFYDNVAYTNSLKSYTADQKLKGKTVAEVRKIEKAHPKPEPNDYYKDLSHAIVEFQERLCVIDKSLTSSFSKNANKIYKKK